MIAAWFQNKAAAFDTETTAPDPEQARLVTATVVQVSPAGAERRGQWLVNPGMPIPPEAMKIHGVTDEMAAQGLPTVDAVAEISHVLEIAWGEGLPLIAMNASYDLTVMQRERARHGMAPMTIGPVLDPLVIDRWMVPYRAGKKARTLGALAEHYRVKLEGAHSSAGDALCAARVVWRQARSFPAIASLTLEQMQEEQAKAHRAWATKFQQYLKSQGKPDVVELEWPVRLPKERAA